MIGNGINISISGEIVESGTPPVTDWILDGVFGSGFWDNNGAWKDTSVWID